VHPYILSYSGSITAHWNGFESACCSTHLTRLNPPCNEFDTCFRHALLDLGRLTPDPNCFGMLSTRFTRLNPPYNDFGILWTCSTLLKMTYSTPDPYCFGMLSTRFEAVVLAMFIYQAFNIYTVYCPCTLSKYSIFHIYSLYTQIETEPLCSHAMIMLCEKLEPQCLTMFDVIMKKVYYY
jgi:hypothetical protein